MQSGRIARITLFYLKYMGVAGISLSSTLELVAQTMSYSISEYFHTWTEKLNLAAEVSAAGHCNNYIF